MNGFKAFEMMKEGKIVCVTNCENIGYRLKNGFIVEQNLIIEDEPLRPAHFDFNLAYDVFDEKRLEKAKIEPDERELITIICRLKELRNDLIFKFNRTDEEETQTLFRIKQNLLYDCTHYIKRFERQRAILYPNCEEIK